jgi:hypothetical protein
MTTQTPPATRAVATHEATVRTRRRARAVAVGAATLLPAAVWLPA